jgi:hypothetical protein
MTEDQLKAPVAKPGPPASTILDRQISDAKHRFVFASTEDLRRYYADRVIGLRFERGDFEMIPRLDTTIRRALVKAMMTTEKKA